MVQSANRVSSTSAISPSIRKVVMRNVTLAALRVVVQSHANSSTVVAIVLANDGLARELPQTRVVIGASGNEIRRISTESTIPDPTLVSGQ